MREIRTALQPHDGVCPFKPARNVVSPVVLVGMPRPISDAELEVLTTIYFGAPLHLARLSLHSYDVAEPYDTYHGPGWLYSRGDLDGQDHDRAFWNTVVGPLTCGGIARVSYGQFRLVGHRHKQRLQRWIRNRRSNDVDLVRAPFVRLAERYGLGESSEIRGIAALADGREDGASGRLPAARVERVLG